MHAMGPNVAGVIGSAIAAGVLLACFGGYVDGTAGEAVIHKPVLRLRGKSVNNAGFFK